MAPILTFTAEEIWDYIPAGSEPKAASVHLADFPEGDPAWLDETLEAEWERLLEVRAEVSKALEEARAARLIGAGLDARVTLRSAEAGLTRLLEAKQDCLRELFIVSQLELAPGSSAAETVSGARVVLRGQRVAGLTVEVEHARGAKCERCWVWSEAVGRDPEHPGLCERCLPILRGS